MKETREILLRPLVTEKMSGQMGAGHYAFVVEKTANKIEIRNAIKARYPDVNIKEVRTMIVRGKNRRQMTRKGLMEGKTASYKKAVVTVDTAGPQIDFFESV